MVLLIFPSLTATNEKLDHPPLGILTVAAPLVARGIDVVILDQTVEENFNVKLLEALSKNPICVGISSMSGRHIRYALEVSKIVKKNSDAPVVWGGVQASLEPLSTIQNQWIDFIVRDDGEESFPELVEALYDRKNNFERLKGIAYKSNGNIIFCDDPEPADINQLPPIPFHLIDFDQYKLGSRSNAWTQFPKKIIPMETSRGCPFSCIFCTESVRKKKWRALPAEKVVEWIEYYTDTYGFHNFQFIDDNLFGNIKRGREIIHRIVQNKLNIRWYSNIRTDFMANAEASFISQMEKSGCRLLTFGAESGSERILKMINKKAHTGDVLTANQKLISTNIVPHFVTIRGFPSESRAEVAQTLLLLIRIVLENKKAFCDSPRLIATPSSKIAEICLGDRLKDYRLEDWSQIFDLFKNTKPPWLTRETYRFIQKHRLVPFLVANVNTGSKFRQFLYRQLLKIYRLILTRSIPKEKS